jgi:hypothetical protein
MIEITKDPVSFSLRERFARDPDYIKALLSEREDSSEFYFGLRLV